MAQPSVASSSIHRDAGSLFKSVTSLDPVLSSGAGPVKTGAAVDLKGFDGAAVIFSFGAPGDTLDGTHLFTCSVTESDTSGGSYSAVPAAGVRVDTGNLVVDANGKASSVQQVTLLGARKQFIKAVVTATGTHTNGTIVGACVVRTNPRFAPAT